jgi:hypothetical protein
MEVPAADHIQPPRPRQTQSVRICAMAASNTGKKFLALAARGLLSITTATRDGVEVVEVLQ